MTFEEAMKAMRDGKKVRRKAWQENEYARCATIIVPLGDGTNYTAYFMFKGNITFMIDPDIDNACVYDIDDIYVPSLIDMDNNDWELVTYSKKTDHGGIEGSWSDSSMRKWIAITTRAFFPSFVRNMAKTKIDIDKEEKHDI